MIKHESLCSAKLNETQNRFGFGPLGLDTKGREKNSESSVTEKRLWNQQQKSSKKNMGSTSLVGVLVVLSHSMGAGLD
nr:MAG TPA: Lipase [Bacteriophage sp.]